MKEYRAPLTPDRSALEETNLLRCRAIAAGGMVLLENRGVLPMQLCDRRIALYGNGARLTVPGGTGSGEVNGRPIVSVEKGLEKAGAIITTKGWLDRYDRAASEAARAYFDQLPDGYRPWQMGAYRPPLTIPLQDGDLGASDGDCAIYVLARNAGEGADRTCTPGDYYPSDEETAFLRALCDHYAHVVVLLNVGGVMDTTFLRAQRGIDAVLLMGQPGCAAGDAVADLLSGAVTPSGRLSATWAERYEDYPYADLFPSVSGEKDDVWYQEGVYVGYRWFDAQNITPAYPFGYGLSYTAFQTSFESASLQDEDVAVRVLVQNCGDRFSGREVVQLYVSPPPDAPDLPRRELKAFAKTGVLTPGETMSMELRFPIASLATYDEARSAYILKAGTYGVLLGRNATDTWPCFVLRCPEEIVVEQLSPILPLDGEMEVFRNTRPPEPLPDSLPSVTILASCLSDRSASADRKPADARESDRVLTMQDLRAGRCTAQDLAAQFTAEELASLCIGIARDGADETSMIGAQARSCPGAAGETTSALRASRDVRNLLLADGPAGLRLCASFATGEQGELLYESSPISAQYEYLYGEKERPEHAVWHYQYCTAIPVATLLAQTWDLDAVREAGDVVGSEMERLGITLWLAPGMNIHRNPLCGRNFEYYAEDPLLSGLCAAADTEGVQSHRGCGTTIKHFACNNQETNRSFSCSHVSERALREIYLKGFEIAVKKSRPLSVMTSYNLLNGIHTANSRDLLTKVLRGEWGYEGTVMTDWGTTNPPLPDREGRLPVYPCSDPAACILAGNDLIMPGSRRDMEALAAFAKTPDGLAALRTCAARILRTVSVSNAYDEA